MRSLLWLLNCRIAVADHAFLPISRSDFTTNTRIYAYHLLYQLTFNSYPPSFFCNMGTAFHPSLTIIYITYMSDISCTL